MYLLYIQFIVGFFFLIKGADLLVEGSSALAKRYRISDLVIGLTIVSAGTSAPELVVNLIAGVQGNSDLALGNILGSNIANVFLILGVSSIITPIIVSPNSLWKEIPMNLGVALILGILLNDMFFDPNPFCHPSDTTGIAPSFCNILGRGDSLLLLSFFMLFLLYVWKQARESSSHEEQANLSWTKSILYTLIGLAGLTIGGDWIVKGGIHIAKISGLSEAVIGIVIIGVGTSLPEVAASSVAAYRGKADIAVGNVLGSNLFNILWVLGISGLVHPLPFRTELNFDLIIMGLAVLIFFLFIVRKAHILSRWKGFVFLILYAVYIVFLLSGGNSIQ